MFAPTDNVRWILPAILIGVAAIQVASATPPPRQQEPELPAEPLNPKAPSLKKVAGINWTVGGQHAIPLLGIIQAVDVSELTPPTSLSSKTLTFQLWYKQFKNPELLRNSNGYASVVDEKVFSDLKPGSGHYADRLGPSGHVIGRVKMKEFDTGRSSTVPSEL